MFGNKFDKKFDDFVIMEKIEKHRKQQIKYNKYKNIIIIITTIKNINKIFLVITKKKK